ncbi:exported hypothetical protein [Candidatus Zixiibacteriota bacterium]|nr:exported hypothetical protein [candidate division Zixibacteria bacterium]
MLGAKFFRATAIIFLLALMLPAIAPATTVRPVADIIEKDYQAGQIDYENKIIYQLMSIRDPEKLPVQYKTSAISAAVSGPGKSATAIFREAWSNLKELSPDGQAKVSQYLTRPGGAYAFDSPGGHFKLHYDISGPNAVPTTDADADGIPDYVEKAASYCDSAWRTEVTNLQYMAPPSDGAVGGDSRYDIYFEEMNYYGYTAPESYGPNPWNDATSYISIHRNFLGFPPNTDPDGDQAGAAKVTIAHEFFHAVQFAYDYSEATWWMEVSSTWMEDIVYDTVNDNYNYLPTFFSSPQTALTDDSYHCYASFIWDKYLQEKFDTSVVRKIWGGCIYSTVGQATNDSLAPLGYNFARGVAEFTTWNYITSSRNDGLHFSEAVSYPAMTIAASHSSYPVNLSSSPVSPAGFGSAYIQFLPGIETGDLEITLDCSDSRTWAAYLIKSTAVNNHVIDSIPLNPSGWTADVTVNNIENYYAVTLVVINTSINTTAAPFAYSARIRTDYAVAGTLMGDTVGYGGAVRPLSYNIQNTGILDDIINVTVYDSLGWLVPPLDTALSLLVGESKTLNYNLGPPAGLPLGTRDKIYLLCQSTGDPAVTDTASVPFRTILQYGDADFDGTINILDVSYIINFLYHAGAVPQPVPAAGDMNCNGMINILDLSSIINHLYRGALGSPCNPF